MKAGRFGKVATCSDLGETVYSLQQRARRKWWEGMEVMEALDLKCKMASKSNADRSLHLASRAKPDRKCIATMIARLHAVQEVTPYMMARRTLLLSISVKRREHLSRQAITYATRAALIGSFLTAPLVTHLRRRLVLPHPGGPHERAAAAAPGINGRRLGRIQALRLVLQEATRGQWKIGHPALNFRRVEPRRSGNRDHGNDRLFRHFCLAGNESAVRLLLTGRRRGQRKERLRALQEAVGLVCIPGVAGEDGGKGQGGCALCEEVDPHVGAVEGPGFPGAFQFGVIPETGPDGALLGGVARQKVVVGVAHLKQNELRSKQLGSD